MSERFNVKFDAGKGTFEDDVQQITVKQTVGDAYTMPEEIPEYKKSRKFKCWCLDSDLKEELTDDMKVESDSPRILYAKYKKNIIPFLILGLVLVAAIILLFLAFCNNWFDPNATQGRWDGKSEEEIQAELNAQVKEGMMAVSIAHTLKFPNGSQNPGTAHIENLEKNHVDQKVSIVINDETVYESGAIAPGYFIDEITLNRYLPPGVYDAQAIFDGYQKDTHKKTGRVVADVKVLVE